MNKLCLLSATAAAALFAAASFAAENSNENADQNAMTQQDMSASQRNNAEATPAMMEAQPAAGGEAMESGKEMKASKADAEKSMDNKKEMKTGAAMEKSTNKHSGKHTVAKKGTHAPAKHEADNAASANPAAGTEKMSGKDAKPAQK